jgi:hypothetical protein
MNQRTARWSCLTGLLAILVLLAISSSSSAAELWYYGYYGEKGECWQTGQLGSESLGCDSVGSGFLEVPGRLVNGGIGQNVDLTPSGDYCSTYVGHVLNKKDPNNEGGSTGFTTPTPFENYQEWDEHNVCQANLTSFGEVVRKANCTLSTCGMHHYASFKEQGYNDRPWATYLGNPKLVISGETNVSVFTTTEPKGWGYICPIFQDAQPPHNVLEYCLQEWRGATNQKPDSEVEHIGTCALGPDSNNIDTVGTFFYPGTKFATQEAGSANTEPVKTGWKYFKASITAENLKTAIELDSKPFLKKPETKESNPELGYGCGRAGGLSTDPKEYALIGIEQGAEAWSFSEIGASEANLQVHDEFTPKAPEVSTGGVTEVGPASATLNGSFNPLGYETNWSFEYGPTTSYGTTVSGGPGGSGLSTVPAQVRLQSKLVPSTTYHYRIVATNAGGTTYGADHEFITAPTPVNTGEATEIGEHQAKLQGTVSPGGVDTHYRWQWGKTTLYEEGSILETDAGSGTSSVPVSEKLTEVLLPGTTYHFRLVTSSSEGEFFGEDRSFTTVSPAAQCAGANVTGKGSSLQLVAQALWAPDFNTSGDLHACNGSQGTKAKPVVSYTASGGTGLESWGVNGGTASFGTSNAFVATDQPPNEAQKAEIEGHGAAGTLLTIPVTQTSVAIVMHLPEHCVASGGPASGRLAMKDTTFEKVFRGATTKWSEFLNSAKLTGTGCNKETEVKRVVPQEGSGTTAMLMKFLSVVHGAEVLPGLTWKQEGEKPGNTTWPAEETHPVLRGVRDEGVAKAVAETSSTIGVVSLSAARANMAFVPPSGGAGKATFWAELQDWSGTVEGKVEYEYSDPSTNGDSETKASANCEGTHYTNGTKKYPPAAAEYAWNEVTTAEIQTHYALCGFSYILSLSRFNAYPGTTHTEEATVASYVSFLTDTGTEGGQTLLEGHDYSILPAEEEASKNVRKIAQQGAAKIAYSLP